MLKRAVLLSVFAFVWGGTVAGASAQHERSYEFDGTHFAVSIERFMGIDFVDPEGPGGSDVSARLLLNASEPVPTSLARLGFDVFIGRLSLGLAGGVTDKEVAIVAPRVGYLLGLTPNLGLWLRGGAFFASAGEDPAPGYTGIYAEALFGWFPYPWLAFTMGPTLDVAFASEGAADYIAIGIPEFAMTAFF